MFIAEATCKCHNARFSSTTQKNANGLRLPCRDTAQGIASPASTQAPLPDFSVCHVPDQRYAPATKPEAEVLPTLVMPFFSCFTRLEGVIPRAVDRMSRLPPRHSFKRFTESPISGVRTQKVPLTHRPKLFATALRPLRAFKRHSRQRLSGKSPASPFLALGLSWLSYSRLSDLPIVPEPGQRSGFDCHQCEGSPRRHTLNEPAFTSRPEPRGRICSLLWPLTDFGT